MLSGGMKVFFSPTMKEANDLGEGFNYLGGSIATPLCGVPLMGGGDFTWGTSPVDNSSQRIYSGSVGLGTPGIEGHSGGSYTFVSHDPVDIATAAWSWLSTIL